jgi:hypothetical protein
MLTVKLRQKCGAMIIIYSGTCTVHTARTSLSSVFLSSYRFLPDINRLLWMYLSFPRHIHAPDPIYSVFFMLRTYALWNNNKVILVLMLSTFIVSPMLWPHPSSWLMNQLGYYPIFHRQSFDDYYFPRWFVCSHFPLLLFVLICSTFTVTTSAIPGITGCYWSSHGVQFSSFVLLFVFQLGMSPERK